MVSYITLWRQLSVLVSHIRLHIAQSISFRIIQMLGTFCIDRCRPFMIKKVQIHYVIRSLHVNMRILRFKRKNMLKSYNNKISPLFSTDCLIGETKYDQDAHQKVSGKESLPSRVQWTFPHWGPQLGYKKRGWCFKDTKSLSLVFHSDKLQWSGIKFTGCSKTSHCWHVYYLNGVKGVVSSTA